MAVQITGLINHNSGAIDRPAKPADFDLATIRRYAKVQEDGGFDRVLIANAATMPDSFAIGTHVAGMTSRLGLMLAHRPGFIAPTMAARMLATIDRLSSGRAGVHIIAGASDLELQADGDFLSKDQRYHRAAEYVDVMRRTWASVEPFDYDGEFYKFRGAQALVRPEGGAVPVFWGGESELAIELAGRWCDVYAILSDNLDGAASLAERGHAAAARAGRSIDVLMTMVVILGETEDEAWERAASLAQRVEQAMPKQQSTDAKSIDHQWKTSTAFTRLAQRAKESERYDTCLWTGINRIMAGRGNHNALVGTPDQVADSLLAYYRRGISRFLLRGFDPLADGERMGRELLPMLRERAAQVDAEQRERVDAH